MKEQTLYYKKPVLNVKGKVTFEQTVFKVKTPILMASIQGCVDQLKEIPDGDVLKRQGMGYIGGEDFEDLKKELNISYKIPESYQYVMVFTNIEATRRLCIIRPIEAREQDRLAWEREEKRQEKFKLSFEDFRKTLRPLMNVSEAFKAKDEKDKNDTLMFMMRAYQEDDSVVAIDEWASKALVELTLEEDGIELKNKPSKGD